MTDYRGEAAKQRAIDLLGGHFCRTGVWPNVDDLQRDLERSGEDFDLRTALDWMDPSLGGTANYPTASLTIRGLARFDGARDDLEHFVAALRLAYERYVGNAPDPKLRREDFDPRGRHPLDELALRKLYVLMESSFVVFGGGSGDANGAWERSIASTIKDYRDVSSVDDYLAVRARLIPERLSPRSVAQAAQDALVDAQEAREARDVRREELRARWAAAAGNVAYLALLVLIVPAVVFVAVQSAIGAPAPSGLIAVGFALVLGIADHIVGLNAREAAGGFRGVVSRKVERWLRDIQFPDGVDQLSSG